MLAALAVAAILATVAAVPAVMWFEGWNRPFDHLWEISTPVDQTVTADGYQVTVHRAYADRLGVRLAMTVEDLEDRWSEFYVGGAEVTDADGRVYEGWNWSGSRTPVDGSTATWARFLMPDDAPGDVLKLRVTVTSLAVRSPEPIPAGLNPERIWTSVGGTWTFEVDVPITRGQAISPAADASAGGITIDLEELGVVPSGTVVRLAVEGLPEVPAGSLYGWLPSATIEHDGEPLSDQPLEPGIVESDGVVTIEALPDVEDLAGHWRITVNGFYAFDRTLGQSREIQGPWVLEFNVTEMP
ncbi:MAG: DUF4179 domain-containing protein [Candidatus Limnocylindrales bacterium]